MAPQINSAKHLTKNKSNSSKTLQKIEKEHFPTLFMRTVYNPNDKNQTKTSLEKKTKEQLSQQNSKLNIAAYDQLKFNPRIQGWLD